MQSASNWVTSVTVSYKYRENELHPLSLWDAIVTSFATRAPTVPKVLSGERDISLSNGSETNLISVGAFSYRVKITAV